MVPAQSSSRPGYRDGSQLQGAWANISMHGHDLISGAFWVRGGACHWSSVHPQTELGRALRRFRIETISRPTVAPLRNCRIPALGKDAILGNIDRRDTSFWLWVN